MQQKFKPVTEFDLTLDEAKRRDDVLGNTWNQKSCRAVTS